MKLWIPLKFKDCLFPDGFLIFHQLQFLPVPFPALDIILVESQSSLVESQSFLGCGASWLFIGPGWPGKRLFSPSLCHINVRRILNVLVLWCIISWGLVSYIYIVDFFVVVIPAS